jgi:O-antigen/teichoic acid export membrane protein
MSSAALPHTRHLLSNTAWNLVGFGGPMVVALFAIPLLIKGLGTAQFGVLSLVWMLVGYFSIFDLGLGRALTKTVSERIGAGRQAEIPTLFWTAITMMALLGVGTACLIWFLAPWGVYRLLKIPPDLQLETLRAFRAVAGSMPVVITTAGLIGLLESHQRFRSINSIRLPTAAFYFLGPLAMLPFTQRLFPIVLLLVAGRLVEWALYFALCLRVVPELRRLLRPRRALLVALLGFGSWMTVSNLAMPLLMHIDRFLIGSLISVTAVTYYVTPAEIVVKMLVLPRAWVSVLFPSFSAHFDTARYAVAGLFERSVKYLLCVSFPLALAVILLADVGLRIWLGPEFARQSAAVMRWLTGGIFIYSLAYLPYSLLQSAGRPDLTAKLHMLEVPLYLLLAPLLIRRFGIQGAAIAWFIRILLETAVLFALARRLVPESWPRVARALMLAVNALLVFGLTSSIGPLGWRLILGAGCGLLVTLFIWRGLFSAEERADLRRWIARAATSRLKPSAR